MGLFSRKNKSSKKNNNKKSKKHMSSDDSVSLLHQPDETRQEVPMNPGPPIRTFDTLKQQVTEDNSIQEIHANYSKGTVPPPARQAAFHGPPRFDWMDIESNAAIKIQSVQRRNMVMQELEDKGMSTAAIRNRKRRRKAAKEAHPYMASQSQDTPSIFACCAVGLAFGDATEDGDDAYRLLEKKKYEERQKQQAAHEEALRRQYMTKHGINPGKIVEALEVVD
ncbi:unnamed protein product [Cylindrotheca closterium]|uniref:Uncharacterized protein n=1 Tax=Cylindrotheca closterium TaxID=2856 RepID=A0AAD2CRB9_9STRA|nr:unnamed protein product [Cylindrotheca closterium]